MVQAHKFINIRIDNVPENDFDYVLSISDENNKIIEISLSFSLNVTKGTPIFITVNKPENLSLSSGKYIESFNGNTTLEEVSVCPFGYFNDSGIN